MRLWVDRKLARFVESLEKDLEVNLPRHWKIVELLWGTIATKEKVRGSRNELQDYCNLFFMINTNTLLDTLIEEKVSKWLEELTYKLLN